MARIRTVVHQAKKKASALHGEKKQINDSQSSYSSLLMVEVGIPTVNMWTSFHVPVAVNERIE